MVKNTTEIVTDDKDFRSSQQERIIKSTEDMGSGLKSIGDYINETKKINKISLWISLGLFGIILVSLIGGLLIVGFDDVKSMFVNQEKTRNINCLFDDKNITLKSFEELHYYKLSYNDSVCVYK